MEEDVDGVAIAGRDSEVGSDVPSLVVPVVKIGRHVAV